MSFRSANCGARILAAVVGLAFLVGCPQPQQPGQTNDNTSNTNTNTNTTPDFGTNQPPDRPVVNPPAPVAPTLPGTGGSGGTGGGGTGGGGGGGGGTPESFIFLRVSEPFTSGVVRPGATVQVKYFLSLSTGLSIDKANWVVARDDNQDGTPDGDAVFTSSTTVPAAAGDNSVTINTNQLSQQGLLVNGMGRFLFGVKVVATNGTTKLEYAQGRITLDGVAPTAQWLSPTNNNVVNRTVSWQPQLKVADTSSGYTVRILLDPDTTANNGNEVEFYKKTFTTPGTRDVPETATALSAFPVGDFRYYYEVTDGIDPIASGYAQNPSTSAAARLLITDRLIGDFDLNQLDPSDAAYANTGAKSKGAILQGFNFNDLAGSTMSGIPDLNNDGIEELLIVARFGKPHLIQASGIGFGEAYMLYGSPTRLRDVLSLNSVGQSSLAGLTFTGIRTPLSHTTWTEGLSDMAVVPDMDGDLLPELIFGFPRTESVSLFNDSPVVQHPDNVGDLGGMGALEYDAFDYLFQAWIPNEAQFTRGGVVIASSSSLMLKNPQRLNRKGDRVLDLHEVGQIFTGMGRDAYTLYVRGAEEAPGQQSIDCPDANDPNNTTPTDYEEWTIYWDVVLASQGPGGFDNYYTSPLFMDTSDPNFPPDPFRLPLANYRRVPITLNQIDQIMVPQTDPNEICLGSYDCLFANAWHSWAKCADFELFPAALVCDFASWHDATPAQLAVWTGFYGPITGPRNGNEIGARVLGQRREDHLGQYVGADGNWLYVSAPRRSALQEDVPALGTAKRDGSGVIYMLRTQAFTDNSPYTETQLWIEPEDDGTSRTWPNIDKHLPNRVDWTMPVPHNYIIEDVGSTRGRERYWGGSGGAEVTGETIGSGPLAGTTWRATYAYGGDACETPDYTAVGGMPANYIRDSGLWGAYGAGISTYYVSQTPQIVGPHVNAALSYVRGLGDVNRDGVPDFAVGSSEIRQTFTDPSNPTGDTVGAIFIVFGRKFGLEGDFLLEQMSLAPSNPNRLRGVLLRGSSANEKLGRVFDGAGDFNGDGVDDVLVGSEGSTGNTGQAIVILGSTTLESPSGGWTVDDIVAANRAIRFRGVNSGDLAGSNVAGAGDVDGDGVDDILIAAPGAEGGKGVVYLVYGSPNLSGSYDLADIGTFALPGARFIGRHSADKLGGGELRFPDDRPGVDLNPAADPATVYARGITKLGDIDGDGYGDYLLGSMLADPNGRVDSGEVYVIYGAGDP